MRVKLASARSTACRLATSVACLFCIAQYFVVRDVASLQAVPHEVLWLSLLNALLCTAAPVLMVMMAIERIGPGLTAQTGMIGPLSTILMGVWLLDEQLKAMLARERELGELKSKVVIALILSLAAALLLPLASGFSLLQGAVIWLAMPLMAA